MQDDLHTRDMLITERERQLIASWNETAHWYPRDACVPELVARQAAATPEAIAVRAGSQSLSYRKLNQKANQLAHSLLASGVGPGTPVGVCLERRLEMVVGLLGILKAGGAYVPLDPGSPDERLGFVLKDASVPVLVTQQSMLERFSTWDVRVICLDSDDVILSQQPVFNPHVRVSPGELAYIIYTSGSTGQPKGVLVTHDSLLNVVFWYQRVFDLRATDKASQLVNIAFDPSVGELWPFLTLGASIDICPDEIRFSPAVLRDWLVSNKIHVATIPMVLTERLMELEWPVSTALRYVVAGGDSMHAYPPSGLPFTICNCYGLTETTIVATYEMVEPTEYPTISPTIGRPIANTEVSILDEQLRQVPIGAVGELYIGGVCLARGYLNRPDLTEAKFMSHPFLPGERLCRTGDLGRYLSDGRIEFLGRADYQVKIRGYRIEPGEVTAVLSRHAAIKECMVVAREDSSGDKRLVAYIVFAGKERAEVRELQTFLKNFLPEYMVPATYVYLEALPLTTNGKLDRRALPAPDASNQLRDLSALEEYTPTQERIAEIVKVLLNLDWVGLDDNIFMLGGHSLLGTQILARITEIFGIDLTLQMLFEFPTVRQLAAEVERLIYARLDEMSEEEILELLSH